MGNTKHKYELLLDLQAIFNPDLFSLVTLILFCYNSYGRLSVTLNVLSQWSHFCLLWFFPICFYFPFFMKLLRLFPYNIYITSYTLTLGIFLFLILDLKETKILNNYEIIFFSNHSKILVKLEDKKLNHKCLLTLHLISYPELSPGSLWFFLC